MPSVATAFRDRFHPLHQIRRIPLFRRLLQAADVPIWWRVYGVSWRVRVRLVRDISHIVLSRSPEPHIAAFVEAAVTLFKPRTFWDVGAYFGYYGFFVKSLDEKVRVVLAEPDPDNASLIRTTLACAPIRDIEVIQVALSDAEGSATFATDPVSGSTGTLETAESVAQKQWGQGRFVRVQTATLDSVIGDDGVLDMVKIDVEGHEERVVRGGRRVLARCQPIVIFECFHGGAEICDRLEGLGYEVFDAERLAPRSLETENFVGLPPRCRGARDDLLNAWRRRLLGTRSRAA